MTTIINESRRYHQTVLPSDLKLPLTIVGDDIRKALVKKDAEGSEFIVPDGHVDHYLFNLDSEIEAARQLVKKPSFTRILVYIFLGLVGTAMFGAELFGLDGVDFFYAYGGLILGCIISYVVDIKTYDAKNDALSTIRTKLIHDFYEKSTNK